jgi:hypothetical protein
VTAVQLTAEHEPGTQAGTDREEDEIVDSASDAAPSFSERSEVDVVLDGERSRSARERRGTLRLPARSRSQRARSVRRRRLRPARRARRCRPRRASRRRPRAANAERFDRLERGLGGPLGQFDVLPRADDLAAYVAPRRGRSGAPRSSPRTNAASGTGSSNVARSSAVVTGSASRTRPRRAATGAPARRWLRDPTRREISAREIGAAD